MTLKEATAEKHKQAETTLFMKRVFDRSLPKELWVDWTFQKTLFYSTIEGAADKLGLLEDLPDLPRSFYLYKDYAEMAENKNQIPHYKKSVIEYHNYLLSISDDKNKIMAHLYTWHMGDMFGGQMIKKIIPGSHHALEFKDAKLLIERIRSKLDESLAQEANTAFDWAITILEEYDTNLVQN